MGQAKPNVRPVADTVTALFLDSTLRFKLPADATFEDLAESLARWGDEHGGSPLYVGVTFRRELALSREVSAL
jgi:hypothetical protein